MKLTMIFLLTGSLLCIAPGDFLQDQLKHKRAKAAYDKNIQSLTEQLRLFNLDPEHVNVLFEVWKKSKELIIHLKSPNDSVYREFKRYSICEYSGKLGPKREQGDNQVPEGLYHITTCNPESSFHLSLRIDYPNDVDRAHRTAGSTGGDIYIHGGCASIGCLAMTNSAIEEVYLLAIMAKDNGQSLIPIYSFPFEMTTSNIQNAKTEVDTYSYNLWIQLQTVFQKFHLKNKAVSYSIANGEYVINLE